MSNRTNLMVPSSWKGQDKRFAESIKETVDCLAGQRGDSLDKAVTVRDLLDSGLAVLPAGAGFYAGLFGDLTPPPVDDLIPNLAVPPAPTSLTANGAFQNILLGWNLEQYVGHSGVEVYRHTSDSITDATMIGRASGSQKLFSDNVGGGASFYYWVRAFNQNGDYGAYNSSAGTLGTTQPDIAFLLSELTGQITSTQLAIDLSTPISLISADSSTAGSVAYRVAQESLARAAAILAESTARSTALLDEASDRTAAISAEVANRVSAISAEASARTADISAETTARISAVSAETSARVSDIASEATARQSAITASATALQNQINDLLDIAPYDASVSYVTDDQVTYLGKLYKASQNTTGNLPTDATFWSLLGDYSSLGDLVGDNLASITALNTVSATTTSAAAQAIHGLNSTVNDATTGLSATSSALDAVKTLVNNTDTGVAASATKIGVLETTVNDATTGVSATSTALDSVETLVNHSDTGVAASATKIGLLETTVNDASTGVSATSSALDTVETLVNHSDTGVAASATKIGLLETTVNDATTGVAATSTALDSVETLVNHSETGVAASSSKISALETTVNDETTGVSATSGALDTVETLVNHSDTGVTASAGKIALLETTVDDPTSGVTATSGALDTLTTAVNHSDTGLSATAGKVTALESTLDGDAGATPPVVGVSTALDAVKTLVEDSATGVTASADKISALESTVNNADTGVTATSGAVETLETAVNHSDTGLSATAGKVTALESTLDGDADASPPVVGVASGFETLKTAVNDSTTGLSAVAGKVTLLETTLNGDAGASPAVEGLSTAFEALDTAVTDSATGLSAVAGKVTALESTVNHVETGVTATAGALETLDTAVKDSETGLSATASKVSALEVTLDGNPDAVPAVSGLSANFNILSNTVTDSETGLAATAGSLSGLAVIVGSASSGLVQAVNLAADEASTTADDIDNLIGSLNVANADADGNSQTDTTLDAAIIRERQIRIDTEGSQATLISGINTTLGKKTQTFFQDAVPTSLSVGDLWIATLDDNKLYRATIVGADQIQAGEWVPAGDQTATTTTFAQNDIPTSGAVGDIWIDTNDKNTVYRAESVGADEVATNEWVKLDLGEALISAGALETLETEVYGADGSAGASRLTAVFAELNDPAAGTSSMAQQLTSVQTEVFGDGGAAASRIDSLKVSVDSKAETFISATVPTATAIGDLWVNSELRDPSQSDPDSDGNPNKPKNHLYRAESADANEVKAGEWVFVDVGQAVSTAEVVSFIDAEVFPDGSSASSSISQISARLADTNGDSTAVTLEQAFEAQALVNGGLSGQYSVKVDNNGHIAGFGLSSVEVNGAVQSAFIVQANKFALVGEGTSGNGIGTVSPAADSLPFVYTTGQTAAPSNGNIDIPAGVYIKSAYIQNGAITTAQIGNATIDTAQITGELTADHIGANTIAADSIDASMLNIDGSTITSVPINGVPTLQIGNVNVNKLTGTEISASIMSGTSVFANKLSGDVNTLIPFRSFANQAYSGSETTMIEVDLTASSHPLGHKPFAICSGYMEPIFERVYRFKMYMKTANVVVTALGYPATAGFTNLYPYGFMRWVTFSGDKSDVINVGQEMYTYMDVKQATVLSVIVNNNVTTVTYSGNVLATTDNLSTRTTTDYVLVGETRTKSRTATRLMFSLTGSKSAPDTGVVGMKVTVTQMNSQDTGFDTQTSGVTINEVSGMIMGVR